MLTLQDVLAKLPAGALTEDGTDVKVSISALTGRAAVALADPVVADAMHDLLKGCADAQTTYNQANASATINSFAQPTTSAATANADGSYGVNFTFTVVTRSPVDLGQTSTNG